MSPAALLAWAILIDYVLWLLVIAVAVRVL
jgi:hypothetical protein